MTNTSTNLFLKSLVENANGALYADRAWEAICRNREYISDESYNEHFTNLSSKIQEHNINIQSLSTQLQAKLASVKDTYHHDERAFLKSASDEIPPEHENSTFAHHVDDYDITLSVYLVTLYIIFITFLQSIFFYY